MRAGETEASFEIRNDKYRTDQIAAKAILDLTLGENAYRVVEDIEDVKEAIHKLKDVFEHQDSGNFVQLVKAFTRTTQESCGGSVATYGAEFQTAWLKLQAYQGAPSESLAMAMFIQNLGEPLQQSFTLGFESRHRIVKLAGTDRDTRPVMSLPELISAAEQWETTLQSNDSTSAAFYAARPPPRGGKRKACEHCGNIHGGTCWVKFPESKPAWIVERESKRQRGEMVLQGNKGS
jgi:hypothetical protein